MDGSSAHKSRINVSRNLYLRLVLPFIIVSLVVSAVSFRSLDRNASALTHALHIQAKANRVLQLILVQDDSSKAILIDPKKLADFSEKKINAYDEHKELLSELSNDAKDAEFLRVIEDLKVIDNSRLRPIDSEILEDLFRNPKRAQKIYFEKYEPARQAYESRVRDLNQRANTMAYDANEKVRSLNQRSLIIITLALAIGIFVVVIAIHILAKQVETSDHNMRMLLGTLNEGIFFFDKDGNIAPERSQATERILPDSSKITTVYQFVRRYSPGVSASQVKTAIGMFWPPKDNTFFSDFQTTAALLPSKLNSNELAGKSIDVTYHPFFNAEGSLHRVFVVISDNSAASQLERESSRQKEKFFKLSSATADINAYRDFTNEVENILTSALTIMNTYAKDSSESAILSRRIHTLKGTVAIYNFKSLSLMVHDLESKISSKHGLIDDEIIHLFNQIISEWRQQRTEMDTMLNIEKYTNSKLISADKISRLDSYVKGIGNPVLTGLVQDLDRQTFSSYVLKYNAYVEQLCIQDDGKSATVITLESDDISAGEMHTIDECMVHILRNCFDHGIEDRATRLSLNKNETGKIALRFKRTTSHLLFCISDDGQGIDTDKLVSKAIRTGIWDADFAKNADFQSKINLIFYSSITTKDSVSEISGRGVGMEAVKEALSQKGGSIRVTSEKGIGTSFEIMLPLA